MDTSQTQPPYPPIQGPGVFGTSLPSSVVFVVAILLFFLPFAEIKCGNTKLVNKSGFNFAIGKDWKQVNNGFFNSGTKSDKSSPTSGKDEGNSQLLIILAVGLGVLGFLFSFAGNKVGGSLGLVAGLLAAVALIAFMIDLKSSFNASLKKEALDKAQENTDTLGLDKIGNAMNDIKPTLAFTPWFYIAVVAFLVAAFFCYKRMQVVKV